MSNKNIFDLSPGLEEKMRNLLGKYEQSLKRRELGNKVRENSSVTMENYKDLSREDFGSDITEKQQLLGNI